jgi:hypothetical protein
MRPVIALALLLAASPAWAQVPRPYCPYGQTCQNQAPVPFPVINPVQGLNNILTLPLKNNEPPPPTPYAPIATPPPVLPPSR